MNTKHYKSPKPRLSQAKDQRSMLCPIMGRMYMRKAGEGATGRKL
jgi:hypothetical protein